MVGIGVVVIASLTFKRAARKKPLAPSVPAEVAEKAVDQKLSWLDRLAQAIRKILIHWGLIPKDELSRSFITAKKLLQKYIGGSNYAYQIPWYLVIGCEHSGKSTLLENINIELPIGRPDFDFEEKNPLLGWWFYDRGIALDVRGDQVLEATHPHSNEESWKYLLSLISRHRPKRPLDGIVLAIPASELVGATALDEDKIFDRGKHLNRKLWQIQASLAMRVPVYVIVTKCDVLTGFDQTVMDLPSHRLNEILGWSNPYSVEAAYSPAWSEKVFTSMADSLRRLRALSFTESKERQERDGAFLLSQAFQTMSPRLRTYLDTIFKDSAYHESFFLRGVYFVGDGARISPEELDAQLEESDTNGDYIPAEARLSFVRDTFVEKILKESELAQPVMRILLSTSRILNFSKLGVLGISLFWLMGIFMAQNKFQDTKRVVFPLLQQIERAVEGTEQLDVSGKEAQFALYLKDQSNAILNLMTQVNKINLFSLAIPGSWFSPLDSHLQESLTFAYDTVILRDLYTALIKKGEDLTNPAKTDQFIPTGKQVSMNPTDLISFTTVKNYVNSLANFEKNTEMYNQLETSQSIDAIGRLVLYLYGKELPAQFYESTNYFRFTLGATHDTNLKVGMYRDIARQKLNELFNKFLTDVFNAQATVKSFIDLQELLVGLNDPAVNKMDDDDLRAFLAKLKAVQEDVKSDNFKWVENKEFYPGEAYNDLMTKIGSSELLGAAIANNLTTEANKQFATFKNLLLNFKSDLSGPFLKTINGQVVAQIGDKFTSLIETLSTFMSQKFMEQIKKYREIQSIPPQQLQFWDETVLQGAANLIDDYRKYVADGLTDAPVELQNVLRTTAQNALRKKLVHFVAQAQLFREQPTGIKTTGLRDMLASQIQNLKTVTPLIARILAVFDGVGFDENANALKDALLEHGYILLKKVDNLVKDENLYNVTENNFQSWAGGKNVAFKVFGVVDNEGLTSYLSAQRERTIFYAKDMARPVLEFLNMNYFEKLPDQLPLILKWDGIAQQIDQYEKKSPGNPLSTLEDFVSTQMNEVTINDCDTIDPAKANGFFNSRLNKMQAFLKQKCEALAEKRFYMRYNKIAQFFNVHLAGRYPFREGKAAGGGSEASPRMIQTFYKVYDRFTPYDLKRLQDEAKDSVAKGEAWDFLTQMAGIRALLVPDETTEDGVTKDPPEFKIEFRTNREQESGGNQITQMGIKFGSKNIDWRDADKSGTFTPGVPIQISFKWAANGQNVPRTDPAQPNLKISGTQAIFTYSGNWGLLKLLTDHSAGSPVGSGATKVWRLRFEIPTTNVAQNQTPGGENPPTVVFIDFELTEKGGGTSTQLVDLSGKLPTSAKLLDETALALAQKNTQEEIKQAEQEDQAEAQKNAL